MDAAVALLAFITLQRFVEFIWDRRNTRRLRAAGAVEFGGLHYPAMMLVHAGWLAGLWVFAYDSPVISGYVAAFLVLQVGRYWVLATLGRRWTTSVIVLPGAPLIESGPYRLLRHPNYVIVAVELALVPLALGLPLYALVSVVLYAGAALLRVQVRIRLWRGCRENRQGMGSKARAIEGVHGRKRESARTGGRFHQICWRAAGLAVCAVPRDPRDVRSGNADVGQFTVAELVELIEARIVTPPGLEEVEDCDQHDLCLSIPG